MKKYTFNEITYYQFVFLIMGTQIGAGFLALPRVLAERAGTDGWMGVVIGWLLSVAASIFLVKTAEKYPNKTVTDILTHLFGRVPGKLATFIYMLYNIWFTWIILINAMLYIKGWFLPNTPDYLIMFLFSIPTFLIVRNGLRIIGRYSELVFYLTIWVPVLFLVPLKDGSFLHLFPLFKVEWSKMAASGLPAIYSFLGFELAFFFYPFLQKKEHAVRGIVIANTLTMLFYLVVTLACFIFISPDEITGYNQPVLNLLKVIEFRFFERVDMIILNILLLIASTTWIPYFYCGVYCSSQLMNKADHHSHVPIFLGLFIAGTLIIHPTWEEFETWQHWMANAGIVFAYLFPAFLWMYSWGYEKYKRRKAL